MKTGAIYIPNTNPIPLYAEGKQPFDEYKYSQKYEQDDITCLQFYSVDSFFTIDIYLKEQCGKLVNKVPLPVNVDTIVGNHKFTFYTTLIKFTDLIGLHYIEIIIKNNVGETCSYYSPCINIQEKHSNTSIIQYYNTHNANGVLFDNGTTFALRVEGGFLPKSYNPKVQENIYQNQQVTFQLLESTPYNSNFFTVGGERGIPDWLFDKVHRSLSCDTVQINGVNMVKIPDTAWSPTEEDGYHLRTWKIELIQSNDNLSREVQCIETAVYNCTLEWLNVDAVCQMGDNDDGQIVATNKTDGYFSFATLGQDGKLYFGSADENGYGIGIWRLDNDGQIVATNKTDSAFSFATFGQDNKLYFGGNHGIWRLDGDGQIVVTNKTDGSFRLATLGQDGKLYFGGNYGIWRLDNDGQIVATNKTDATFSFATLGQDGKLYFGGNYGIWRLDNDGQIVATNKTDATFSFATLGQDNKLYFGGGDGTGIYRLDGDGQIVATNKTDGYFSFATLGQDGKLYFSGGYNYGIYRLDGDGQIVATNKTDGTFYFATLGQDNKLYFGSYDSGIWRLDDDGQIVATNKTDSAFSFATLGQDGKLYFGGGNGIYRLDGDGQIVATNKTDGSFRFATLGQDGKLYFGGYGIYRLETLEKTGNSLKYKGEYKLYRNGVLQSKLPLNILNAFGSTPAITIEQWSKFTDGEAKERETAYISTLNVCTSYEELNTIIGYGECIDVFIDVLGGKNSLGLFPLNFGDDTAIQIKFTKE